jgi:hypothetical protein
MKAALARLRGGGDREDAEAGGGRGDRGGGPLNSSGHQRLANAQRVLADQVCWISLSPVGLSRALDESAIGAAFMAGCGREEGKKEEESKIAAKEDPLSKRAFFWSKRAAP